MLMNDRIDEVLPRFDKLPRASLGFFPTPLQRLDRLSDRLGVSLYIKRDDFTGMSLFGGNKVRKLEFLLGEAKKNGCEYAVTYGATQSNHAMETATACRRLGMKPILYLTAVVPPDDRDVRANLLLDRMLDAEIHIVPIEPGETEAEAEARSFVMGAARAAELTLGGRPCIDIPMGGAAPIGSVGFALGYVELAQQLGALGVTADYLFHSTGTGGTLAGLAAGRKLLYDGTRIVSISASPKDPVAYPRRVAELGNAVLRMLDSTLSIDPELDLCVDTSYYLPGYEQPNAAASEAIRLLAREEGLFLDPVYTGKAFAGMLDYIRTGRVAQGDTVVFWHTGGATALFAEREILGDIL